MVETLRGPLPHPGQVSLPPQRALAAQDSLSRLPAQAAQTHNPVALDFEKQVLTTMVEDMLKTSKVETFGGGHAEEMWRSFLARGIADSIVDSGGIGLAGSIDSAISAYQGKR